MRVTNKPSPQYKAVRQSVTPHQAEGELKKIDSCYLGVSLETPAFEPPMLNATVDWIATQFKVCTIAVGDSIHRHTLQILRGLSAFEARHEALRLGEKFLNQNRNLFRKYDTCRFDFVKFSQIQEEAEYQMYERQIWGLFQTDPQFKASVEKSARSFVARQIRKFQKNVENNDRLIGLSCSYILEEIACFTWLAKNGRRVDVYPGGELPVLVDVAHGKYAVPDPLRKRINVALKLYEEK